MKTTKAKEPVTIRFKELANGNKSIYLDIYRNGKREYKFLKLYLVPQKTPFDKAQNANAMQAAQFQKSEIIKQLANDEAGIFTAKKVLLSDYWAQVVESKRRNGKAAKTMETYQTAMKKVLSYKGDIYLNAIDRKYLVGLSEYLVSVSNGITAKMYFNFLNSVLNCAYKDEIIKANPISKLDTCDRIKGKSKEIEYLTADELRKLIDTPLRELTFNVRNAYLFACFVGLRYSDIQKLVWGDLATDEQGNTRIIGETKKTKTAFNNLVPLSALQFLPTRGKDFEPVFNLPGNVFTNRKLSEWAKSAGIDKKITFHTARHTFATLLLTKGADLYTVSKLLGHSNISTTQIYAKVIDKKRDEAASLLNQVL